MKRIYFLFCFAWAALAGDEIAELKEKVIAALPEFLGWCSKEKAVHFIDLVAEVKPDLCVEIGVFGGSSLFPVASTLKYLQKGIVVGIDPWNKNEVVPYFHPTRERHHIEWWSKVQYEQVYQGCLAAIEKYEFQDFAILLRATSEQVSRAIGKIDILYLDGNHNEKISNQDVRLYLPKVRPGGYIWMNDTLTADLQSSIDLLLESCDVVKLIDGGNSILFKKR